MLLCCVCRSQEFCLPCWSHNRSSGLGLPGQICLLCTSRPPFLPPFFHSKMGVEAILRQTGQTSCFSFCSFLCLPNATLQSTLIWRLAMCGRVYIFLFGVFDGCCFVCCLFTLNPSTTTACRPPPPPFLSFYSCKNFHRIYFFICATSHTLPRCGQPRQFSFFSYLFVQLFVFCSAPDSPNFLFVQLYEFCSAPDSADLFPRLFSEFNLFGVH